MKKSLFNLTIPTIGGVLLFNSFSGKTIKLDEYESASWISELSRLSESTKKWLHRYHFLVNDNVNEVDELLTNFYNLREKRKKKTTPHYRILPTTHCNANCEYCFEKNLTHHTLTEDTAKQIVAYILNHVADAKKISFGWFGGEPLLNPRMITYIVQELKLLKPELIISSSMITNGSLLTDDIINDARSTWNLKKVQITLDGLEKQHNHIKNYSNKKYGFSQTIENIHKLVNNHIAVDLRVNVDVKRLPDALQLIDYLYTEFQNTVRVYYSMIFSTENYSVNDDESSLTLAESVLFKKLCDYHYINPRKLFKRRYYTCGFASYENYLAIDANGDLYKCCEAMIKPEISKVGDIWSENVSAEKVSKWLSLDIRDKCTSCPYLPICMGGCKCASFNIPAGDCFRFKNIIREIVQWEYLQNELKKNKLSVAKRP